MATTSEKRSIAGIEMHASLGAIAAEWLKLESAGIATPYQTYEWTRAWVETLGQTSGLAIRFARLLDSNQQTIGILPLGLSSSALGKKAVFPGGKHANFNMMVFSRNAMTDLDQTEWMSALKKVAALCDIDCFEFIHQPRQWMGIENPFLKLPHLKSANAAYRADLLPDGDEMIRSLMSSESRKKLRNKEKRIGEPGTVSLRKAETTEDIERIIAIFLQQKATRFRNQGFPNPFAATEAIEFLRQGCNRKGSADPAVKLYYLSTGEKVVSVLGATEHAGRSSGMFTSFDDSQDVIRYSPGDLLLLHLVRHLSDSGYAIFDLGTGDAAYKGDYCQTEEELFDSILPMTMRGHLLATALRSAHDAKRWIKHNPTALKLARRFGR